MRAVWRSHDAPLRCLMTLPCRLAGLAFLASKTAFLPSGFWVIHTKQRVFAKALKRDTS